MKPSEKDKWLDEVISRMAAVDKPVPNFEKWRQDHPKAVEALKLQAKRHTRHRERMIPAVQIWRMIMKSRISKLAAAAVIIIAILIGVNHFGGSIDGASVAWAEVAEKIEQMPAHIVRAKVVATYQDSNMPFLQLDAVKYTSPKYGYREDSYDEYGNLGHRIYILTREKISIRVTPVLKEFKVAELTNEQVSMFQMSAEQLLELLKSGQYTELGHKTIDGVEAEGIEFSDPVLLANMGYPVKFDNLMMRFWVDVQTSLPIQIEFEAVTSDKFVTIWSGGKPIRAEAVVDEFEWYAELDQSIFEPNIPNDYTLVSDEADSTGEGKAVLGLETFAELTGGQYPNNLDMMTVLQQGCPVIQEYISEKPDDEEGIEKMREMIFGAKPSCLFYAELVKQGKDVAYYGDSVTDEDANAVLMRWKISDDEYRVIFGDLTTENIGAEQLAELEKSPFE